MRADPLFDDERIEEGEDEASSTYLTFDLGEQTLGVEVRHVREIIDRQRITRLPNAPMEVLGVVDLRGESVPIVDMSSRLGVAAGELGDEARIVVFEVGPPERRRPLGIEADRVRKVDRIGPEEIEPVPSRDLGGWDAGSLRGLCRRDADLVVLIDLDRILGAAGAGPALAGLAPAH